MMSNEELKNNLNHIINECEELAQWIGEVHAAMGEDMYARLDSLLDSLYDTAVDMSRIATSTRLAMAIHNGQFDNKKDKEGE